MNFYLLHQYIEYKRTKLIQAYLMNEVHVNVSHPILQV